MSRGRGRSAERRLRVGVLGCGAIAHIAHIPNLRRRPDLFELVGVADASRRLTRWTAERFDARAFESGAQLIEAAGAEALVVATPHAAHAEAVLDAIEREVHVLVEKPLCVASGDAQRIAALAQRRGVVVQVGYMKRHDDAFAALCADLEADAGRLLAVHASTIEGASLPRTFQPADVAAADDISEATRAKWQAAERRQTREAVGSATSEDVAVYRGLFLADFVHDLNLVHAILALAGEQPTSGHEARWWNGGRAGRMRFKTAHGVECAIDYVEVRGAVEYEEQVTVVTDRSVQRLSFPAPYLDRAATVYERRVEGDRAVTSTVFRSVREPFATELERFRACVLAGERCLTPASESVADLLALERAFVAGRRAIASRRESSGDG